MIDTHAHLDDPQYADDFLAFVADQKQSGVEAVIIPGINIGSATAVFQTCNMAPYFCFPAMGIHPEEITADWQQQIEVVRQTLHSHRCIAVGEIGLDYHFDVTFKRQQQEALEAQLELALEHDLPVLLHNRDSTEDMLQLLLPFAKRGLRGVMHCFSGSRETAVRVLDMGFYLGIGGVLTFKNSRLPETLASLPLNRLVLETDAPYMAPVPFRGKRNEPKFIQYVIERLALVYDISASDIDAATTANAHTLFNFAQPL